MNRISVKQFELSITTGADGQQQVRSSFDASGAELSPCGRYRYRLWRAWAAEGPRVLFVMINPSTADAVNPDQTITKCIGFAKRWGHASLEVVNLFGFRSPDVKDLRRVVDPVGPGNDAAIRAAVARAHQVVAAWGPKPIVKQRAPAVLELLTRTHDVHAIRLADNGEPCHPLMLPYDSKLALLRGRA